MGDAMVCDVFVCRMWKAGGLFDHVEGGRETVNCGEFQASELCSAPPRPALLPYR